MKKYINIITILVVALFVIGSGVIVYTGRPAYRLEEELEDQIPSANTPVNSPLTNSPQGTDLKFSLAEVQKHNSPSDCWSAINGSVYDLTSWISRHPGGPEAIISLCGADGSVLFNGQHGGQRRPASALVLLKIGTLQ